LSFCRIPFAIVDLQHRAIKYQRGLGLSHTLTHRDAIGYVEIAMVERVYVMVGRQSFREMAADESRRARNQDLHKARV
jgi:hypothetical protein